MTAPGYFVPHFVFSDVFYGCISDRQITVAVHIPSGLTRKQFIVSVDETRKFLNIAFTWPEVITDVTKLLKFRSEANGQQNMEPYHLIVSAVGNVFRNLLIRENESIKSTVRIALPVTGEKHLKSQKDLNSEKMARQKSLLEHCL